MSRNIRWGTVLRVPNDKGPYKIATVESDGAEYEVSVLDLGGVQSQPVVGGQVIMFLPDGDEGKAAGIFQPPPADRVDQQAAGASTFKNWTHGQSIVLGDDGKITINGPLVVNGDIEHTGNMTTSGTHTDSTGPHTA
ncbi:MAG: hypothetical protein NW216_07615 [Hyphomicrobium sp.]|nr:hypothetical protein [Hyphomicrobium sp.]